MNVASASTTASDVRRGEDSKRHRRRRHQDGAIISTDHNDYDRDAISSPPVDSSLVKTGEESSAQSSISNISIARKHRRDNKVDPLDSTDYHRASRGCADISSSRPIEFTYSPLPIDNQLLQKQIGYLQHEPAKCGISPPPSFAQLIIYPHDKCKKTWAGCFEAIRHRREIVHCRMNGMRKNGSSSERCIRRRSSFP